MNLPRCVLLICGVMLGFASAALAQHSVMNLPTSGIDFSYTGTATELKPTKFEIDQTETDVDDGDFRARYTVFGLRATASIPGSGTLRRGRFEGGVLFGRAAFTLTDANGEEEGITWDSAVGFTLGFGMDLGRKVNEANEIGVVFSLGLDLFVTGSEPNNSDETYEEARMAEAALPIMLGGYWKTQRSESLSMRGILGVVGSARTVAVVMRDRDGLLPELDLELENRNAGDVLLGFSVAASSVNFGFMLSVGNRTAITLSFGLNF